MKTHSTIYSKGLALLLITFIAFATSAQSAWVCLQQFYWVNSPTSYQVSGDGTLYSAHGDFNYSGYGTALLYVELRIDNVTIDTDWKGEPIEGSTGSSCITVYSYGKPPSQWVNREDLECFVTGRMKLAGGEFGNPHTSEVKYVDITP